MQHIYKKSIMKKFVFLFFTLVTINVFSQIEITFQDNILPNQVAFRKGSEKKMNALTISNPIIIESSDEPVVIAINDNEIVFPSSSSKITVYLNSEFPVESITILEFQDWATTIRLKNSIEESLKYKSILLDTSQYIKVIDQEWMVYEKHLTSIQDNEKLNNVIAYELDWLSTQRKNNWKKQIYKMGVNYRRLSFQQRMRSVWGTPAIDFEAQNAVGEKVHLSTLKGKPIIIDFWATWCGPCKAEVTFINQLSQKYGDQVHFLSVGVKSPHDKWKVMKEELNVAYNWFISKEKMTQIDLWEVYFIPRYMVIDKDFNVYLTDAPKPSSGALEAVIKDLLNVD